MDNNTATLTENSSDTELMEAYESLRRQACGESIGDEKQTPEEAVITEGWTVIRNITEGTNVPGRPVLAIDPADRLWVVNDLDGPWAIQVGDAE